MPGLKPEAIAALRAGVARAKEIPEGFMMEDWVVKKDDVPCGTAGCLAFEILAAKGVKLKQITQISCGDRAEKILGVYLPSIFYLDEWPKALRAAYNRAEHFSLERALVLERAAENWILGDGEFACERCNSEYGLSSPRNSDAVLCRKCMAKVAKERRERKVGKQKEATSRNKKKAKND